MTLLKLVRTTEFSAYFIIGGITTLLDWSLFWIAITFLKLHYEEALVFGYVLAGLFHYFTNKFITFRCRSKQIGSQYFVYLILTTLSLLISMGFIAILIHYLLFNPMVARILTTLVLVLPNYLTHKYITFSKKMFLQAENP